MAEEDLVLNIPIRYIFPSESPMETLGRQAAEGATFGSPGMGRGGSANPQERALRLQESDKDRQMARYSLGDGLNEEGSAKRARAFQWSSILDTALDTSSSVVGGFGKGRRPAATFAIDKLGPESFDFPSDDYGDDPLSARGGGSRRRSRTLERQRRLREERANEDSAPPSGVQFGPGGGPSAGYNRDMAEDQVKNSSWFGRNMPTAYDATRGGGGGLSVFYKRFLVMEAFRTAGALAENMADSAGNLAATGGGQLAMAQYHQNEARSLAGAMPFGMGQIAYSIADGIYGSSTAVGLAQLGKMDEQGMANRLALSTARLNAYETSQTMQAGFGYQRTIAGINQQEEADKRLAREHEKQESDEITAKGDREKAAIKAKHQGAGLRESALDDLGWYDDEYEAVDKRTGEARSHTASHREAEEKSIAITGAARREDATRERDASIYSHTVAAHEYSQATERNPDKNITSRYNDTIEGLKYQPEEFRAVMGREAEARRNYGQQTLRDDRSALSGQLAVGLGVSALRATAYGPGADSKNRQADILGVVGGAELEAQSILRKDQTDVGLSQADTVRQIGINNLRGYAARYIQGFSSTEVGRNQIAPGNQDSSNPDEVFKSIDAGISTLKKDKGSRDISDASDSLGGGTVPNLLQQILDTLVGGALLITP